jgi:hypothetical protein
MPKHEEKICERCAAPFECKVGSINECQCSDLVLSGPMRDFLDNSFFDCLCIDCLKTMNDKLMAISPPAPQRGGTFVPPLGGGGAGTEGVHYYLENGYFVLTETYLLLRGYCCQNGCRHCPYGFSLVG